MIIDIKISDFDKYTVYIIKTKNCMWYTEITQVIAWISVIIKLTE